MLDVFCIRNDLILISPLIIVLQQMLVVCSATAKSFAYMINGNKSHCLSLGKLANVDICPMLFDNQSIAWCHSISYLGVHLLSVKGPSFGIAPIKMVFNASCNISSSFSWCWWNHSYLALFKKYIVYQFYYMLHLLSTWNLTNYWSLKFGRIPFITKFQHEKISQKFYFLCRQTWSFTCHYAVESFFLKPPFNDW